MSTCRSATACSAVEASVTRVAWNTATFVSARMALARRRQGAVGIHIVGQTLALDL